MKIGVSFPQTEIGTDIGVIHEFIQAAEDLGYDYISVFDHVLGGDPTHHPEIQQGAYTHESQFHEPMVLLGYIAGITQRIDLATGIMILPQRQTALMAKEAAEVDVLSGGRLRLGVGIGSNAIEYEALGEEFHNRGRRIEEQVEVMRLLWTQELVDFQGRWHKISHAGINPLPVQRPIPLWMGGGADVVVRRIARMADGWILPSFSHEGAQEKMQQVRTYAAEFGREPSAIAIGGRMKYGPGREEKVDTWRKLEVDELTVSFSGAGLKPPDGHLNAMRRFKDSVGL